MKTVNLHSAAPEIHGGVKAVMLARKIQSSLSDGVSLEEVIAAKVPTLNVPELEADVKEMYGGIASVHNIAAENVDSVWVKQRLNSVLADKTIDQCAIYLENLIEASATAYPTVKLNASESEILAKAKGAEEKTDDHISELLAIADCLLPQVGALMQRSYFRGMSKLVDKIDTQKVTAQVDFGENYEIAYAAAYYIMQKKGELVLAEESDGNLSAYMLGTIAAANVENSKLMIAFSAGKITAEYLGERLRALYTAVVTYISENAIHIAAFFTHKALAATLTLYFTAVLIEFGVAAYFSPFIIFVGAYVAASELFTADEVESAIQTIWNIIKGVWSFIWNALPIRPRDDNPNNSLELEGDSETETAPVHARA